MLFTVFSECVNSFGVYLGDVVISKSLPVRYKHFFCYFIKSDAANPAGCTGKVSVNYVRVNADSLKYLR